MPGWWIHVAVARKTLLELSGHASLFSSGGPSAVDLQYIAQQHPAYVALGAIGPDLFFLLPDFAPAGTSIHNIDASTLLFGAAKAVIDVYDVLDPLLANYADQWQPLQQNQSAILNAATGGLAQSIGNAAIELGKAIRSGFLTVVSTQYDVWGILGSGVPKGVDEQVYYWSDMLHYRKTYEFARAMWERARLAGDDRFKAYAIGWMTHLATDVTGHAMVNEKCGGPWRLHWQRHHCCENHFDGAVYEQQYGAGAYYQDFSRSAMHLWLAFRDPDGGNPADSLYNVLDAGDDRPPYPTGDDPADVLGRKEAWDEDSVMPDALAQFIHDSLTDVYTPAVVDPPGNKGQWAPHPRILDALNVGNTTGFPAPEDIKSTYWWLYKYVKFTTTDYYRFQPPEPPPVFSFAPVPQPPNPPASPAPPGSAPNTLPPLVDLCCHVLEQLDYFQQVLTYNIANLVNLITGPITWPLREAIYQLIQIPLYNTELMFHYYLSLVGYVHPFNQEISPALTTLGVGFEHVWQGIAAAVMSPLGGLPQAAPTGTESSGSGRSHPPLDVVTDPPASASIVEAALGVALGGPCGQGEVPSEFTRPYIFPSKDNEGDPIGRELPGVVAGPYLPGQDATALLGNTAGDANVRALLEGAGSEADTRVIVDTNLGPSVANKRHLGDPADYSTYVIAQLTRDAPGPIANFNLDADRGYGYLCWDWVRSPQQLAEPKHRGGEHPPVFPPADPRTYHAPVAPGYGWCDQELVAPLAPPVPRMHQPGSSTPVQIRYIDKEVKS